MSIVMIGYTKESMKSEYVYGDLNAWKIAVNDRSGMALGVKILESERKLI